MCRGGPRPSCRLLRCSHAHFHLSRTWWSSGASEHLHTNLRTRERQSIQITARAHCRVFLLGTVPRPTNRKPLTMLLRSPGPYNVSFRVHGGQALPEIVDLRFRAEVTMAKGRYRRKLCAPPSIRYMNIQATRRSTTQSIQTPGSVSTVVQNRPRTAVPTRRSIHPVPSSPFRFMYEPSFRVLPAEIQL